MMVNKVMSRTHSARRRQEPTPRRAPSAKAKVAGAKVEDVGVERAASANMLVKMMKILTKVQRMTKIWKRKTSRRHHHCLV